MAFKLQPPDIMGTQDFKSMFWQKWFKDLWTILHSGATANIISNTITAAGATQLSGDMTVVFVDCTLGNITLTLPPAKLYPEGFSVGYKIYRIDASANSVTVATQGTDTINGAASITIAATSVKNINSNGISKYYGY